MIFSIFPSNRYEYSLKNKKKIFPFPVIFRFFREIDFNFHPSNMDCFGKITFFIFWFNLKK